MSRLVDENGCVIEPASPQEQEQLARLANYQRPPIVPPQLHESYRAVLKRAEQVWLERQGQYHVTPYWRNPTTITANIEQKCWRIEEGDGSKDEDSWVDIINYACIGLLLSRGQWKEDA